MISGDVLKYRKGFFIREGYETAHFRSSTFPLTLPRAVIFQDGVRRDGRTVKHMVDRGRIDLIVCAEIRKTVDHADGWVRGRRQHFVGQRSIALGVRAHQVRKRAADVNANQVHRVPFPPELSQFVLEVAFVEIVYWNWQ
jgi:hypothetical protein